MSLVLPQTTVESQCKTFHTHLEQVNDDESREETGLPLIKISFPLNRSI